MKQDGDDRLEDASVWANLNGEWTARTGYARKRLDAPVRRGNFNPGVVMSKRFPVPEFDRDIFKNRPGVAPRLLDAASQAGLREAAKRQEAGVLGGHDIEVAHALAAKYGFEGQHLHAVLCILPQSPVRMLGRSWAWPIQRALVLDGSDVSSAQVLADWTTTRPMCTRLGPDDGIMLSGGPVVVLMGNRVGARWISNRTLLSNDGAGAGSGFSVISACGEENDFHACNLTFTWA
jgi:hypothetical protein